MNTDPRRDEAPMRARGDREHTEAPAEATGTDPGTDEEQRNDVAGDHGHGGGP